jgi:hypothetical protein
MSDEFELKVVVARSWREFEKRQFVAIKELRDKVPDYIKIEFHINVNETVDHHLVDLITQYVQSKRGSLKIYNDAFFDEYASNKGIESNKIQEFREWKWIYHILLYNYLYEVHNVDYLLTYDDDILFNEQDIPDVIHCIAHKVPFAIADQYSDGDKCMMGKLCVRFGAWFNDEYYSNNANTFSSNSGFLGLNNEIFKLFKSDKAFADLINMFDYKKWDHITMQGLGFESYKILLQEQSFLGILNRVFSSRQHIVLYEREGYLISSDMEKIKQSRIEHYVGTSKYEESYLNEVESRFQKYYNELK